VKNFIKKILSNQYLNDFINFYKSAEMSLSSIAVAYYLIISLFPMLLIIGNALPYFHLNTGQILHFFQEYLPAPVFDGLEDVIKSLFEQSNPALLSFSILVGVWTFARALDALQLSMNKAYGVNLHRDFFFRRLIGIFVGIIILLFIYVMIMLTTAGGVALTLIREHIAIDQGLYSFLHNLSLPIVALTVFISLSLLYFLLPNVKIPKARYIFPGALFSMIILVFFTNITAQYITQTLYRFADIKIVGSLVIVALMVWFIFIARVLIIGAIFNAIYQKKKEGTIHTRQGDIVEIIKDWRKS